MKKFLSKLTPLQELIIVLAVAFGWLIYLSNIHFFRNFLNTDNSGEVNYFYNNFSYLSSLIYQLVIIGVMAIFLEARNWRANDFPIRITWKAIGAGFLLLFLNNFILNMSLYLPFFQDVADGVQSTNLVNRANVSIPLAILSAAIISPFFEEILLIGYLGKWFEKYSPVIFILASTLLRISYHTYQGFFGIYSVAIGGIIFTLYFLKYRNLTPIILTHILFNLGYYIRTFYFNESP